MSNYNYPPGMSDSALEVERSTPEIADYWCPECGHHVKNGHGWVEGDQEGDFFCGKKCKYRYDHPDSLDEEI